MSLKFWALVFVVATLVSMLVLTFVRTGEERRRRAAIDRILADSTHTRRGAPAASGGAYLMTAVEILARVSPVFSNRDAAEVGRTLAQAGYLNADALACYRAASTVLAVGLLAVAGVLLWLQGGSPTGMQWLLAGVLPLLLSMRLPALYVGQRAAARVYAIQKSLPELIDLLVICIEGGQTFDAALRRSSRELSRHNSLLAIELDRVNQKIRAGASRADALRELAERTALDDVRELVTMIIQADRYGVSLGDSLRVHADSMRVRRLQKAEEQAAKLPVKVMAPLMLCLLPALVIILFGPAAMSLGKVFGFG